MSHSHCIRGKSEPQGSAALCKPPRMRYRAYLALAASLPLVACSQISGLLHSDMAPAPVETVAATSPQNPVSNCADCVDNKTAAPAAATVTVAPVVQTQVQPQAVVAATPAAATEPAATAATHTAAATAPAATATADSAKPYYVHVGAFGVPANANNAYQKVLATGIMVSTQEVDTPKGRLTRVRAGPFLTRADADTAAKRIHELELDAVVLRDTPAH